MLIQFLSSALKLVMFRNAGIVCKKQSTSEKLIYSVKECPKEWRMEKCRREVESVTGCDIA